MAATSDGDGGPRQFQPEIIRHQRTGEGRQRLGNTLSSKSSSQIKGEILAKDLKCHSGPRVGDSFGSQVPGNNILVDGWAR